MIVSIHYDFYGGISLMRFLKRYSYGPRNIFVHLELKDEYAPPMMAWKTLMREDRIEVHLTY